MAPTRAPRPGGAARAPSSSSALALAASALLLLAALAAPAAARSTPTAAPSGSTQANLDAVLAKYLTNAELAAWADDFASRCGAVARKYTIGKSASGRSDLIVLEISDRPGTREPEPSFQYVANMHGNEPSGRALLPALAEHLCANADPRTAKDPQAARLVRDAHVHMLLTMNPDGYESRRRENANYADLNRDFPDPVARGVALDGAGGDGAIFSSPKAPGAKTDYDAAAAAVQKPSGNEQPETLAVMKWMLDPPASSAEKGGGARFTAGANLHEGAVVANYPWDGYADGSEASRGVVRSAPENAAFVHMSKTYANAHGFMSRSKEFKDGIVNGAQWYPVYGGLQDWGYVAAGTLGITLELSQEKMRPASDLSALWKENKAALVALPVAAVLGGARGRVWAPKKGGGGGGGDENRAPVPGAGLAFDGVNRTTAADAAFGFFARPLAPGKHVVRAWAPGYATLERSFEVPADGSGAWLDLVLEPLSGGGGGGGGGQKEEGVAAAAAAASTGLRAGGGRKPNSSEPAAWSSLRREEDAAGEEREEEGQGDKAAAAAAATRGAAGGRAVSAGALVVLAQAGMIVAVAGSIAVQRRRSGATPNSNGGGNGGGGGGPGGALSVGLAPVVGAFRPSRQPPSWRPLPLREGAAV